MYEDTGEESSLADMWRKILPKEVSNFFGGLEAQDAYRFSSIVDWRIRKLYPEFGTREEDSLDELIEVLAHASKVSCKDLNPRHKVLCVHKNERGQLEFNFHRTGKCPVILKFLEQKKREWEESK